MIRSLLVIVFVFASALSPVDAQEQIIKDWREQRSKIKSIRLKATGTTTHPKGGMNMFRSMLDLPKTEREFDIPLVDRTAPQVLELHIDLEHNRARKRTVQDYVGRFGVEWTTQERSWAYDGTKTYTAMHTHNQLQFYPKSRSWTVLTKDIYPVVFALGVVRSIDGQRTLDLSFKNSMTLLDNATLGDGTDVVIRMPRTDKTTWEFVVAPERNHAITEFTEYLNGLPNMSYEMQLQQIDDLWGPKSWKTIWFDGTKVRKREELRVTEIQINPEFKIEDFQIEPGPDYDVYDHTDDDED